MRRLIYLFTLAGWLFLPSALARDVPFVPTPEKVVDRMLEMAKVGPNDVVYDLGSGDGRIVIAAAKKHGARGVGIDIDPDRIKEARANARRPRSPTASTSARATSSRPTSARPPW